MSSANSGTHITVQVRHAVRHSSRKVIQHQFPAQVPAQQRLTIPLHAAHLLRGGLLSERGDSGASTSTCYASMQIAHFGSAQTKYHASMAVQAVICA